MLKRWPLSLHQIIIQLPKLPGRFPSTRTRGSFAFFTIEPWTPGTHAWVWCREPESDQCMARASAPGRGVRGRIMMSSPNWSARGVCRAFRKCRPRAGVDHRRGFPKCPTCTSTVFPTRSLSDFGFAQNGDRQPPSAESIDEGACEIKGTCRPQRRLKSAFSFSRIPVPIPETIGNESVADFAHFVHRVPIV